MCIKHMFLVLFSMSARAGPYMRVKKPEFPLSLLKKDFWHLRARSHFKQGHFIKGKNREHVFKAKKKAVTMVRRLKDARLLKDILYSELADGSRAIDRSLLRFNDVCKCDLKTCGIDIVNWEVFCAERSKWKKAVKEGALKSEILRE